MRNRNRETQILQLLGRHGDLGVADICRELTVSEATVRRDLAGMEQRGLLRRVHGGATLDGVSVIEPQFQDKEDRNRDAKQRIAGRALDLIEDGDEIYLDGGSTVLLLARLLSRKRNLTIVTNSLMAAAGLMDTEHRLILVGGEFRSRSRVTIGPLTTPVIQTLRVRLAFMGTIGFTLEDGMTTTDPGEAFTKQQIMARARQVILLADHSKFGVASFAGSGGPDSVDVVVTDNLDAEWQRDLRQLGIEVLQTDASGLTDEPTPAERGD